MLANSIATASDAKREDRDCTVRALAVAIGGDYNAAHATLKSMGRKHRRGIHSYTWLKAYSRHNLAVDEVTRNFDGKTIRSLTKELALLDEDNVYLIVVTGHVAAFDGKTKKLVDWADGRLHRIQEIYRVRKIGEKKAVNKPLPKIADANFSSLHDVTFIIPGKREGHWKIMLRENGKVRHINDDIWCEGSAEDKAERAAYKRFYSYAGTFDNLAHFEEENK